MNDETFKWSVITKLLSYKSKKQLIKVDVNVWLETMTEDEWKEYPRFSRWREKSQEFYPSRFPITKDGTINWYKEQVFGREDRILFWVCSNQGKLGHIGLSRFNWQERTCEIDNVLRGNENEPGAMSKALEWLVHMAKNHLVVNGIYLRTFADNFRAIRYYKKAGFHSFKKVGLRKEVSGDRVDYIEDDTHHEKHILYMEYKK